MKHIIILGDGMADHSIAMLGGRTPLQAAEIPYIDMLASKGRVGRFITVPEGYEPGSEVANMSVLGYDVSKVYEGRGVLEAASMGIDIADDEMAMRLNLINIADHCLKSHSAGHITTEEAAELIDYLSNNIDFPELKIHKGIQYRHLLVMKGGNKHIETAPPHDHPDEPFMPLLPTAQRQEAEHTAEVLRQLILTSQQLLADHPINIKRQQEGKLPANSVWVWSPGYRPDMETLNARFPLIKRGSVISAVDLIRGIGRYAGLESIEVQGATGLHNTNYAGKATAAIEALRTQDFVFLHIEAPDEAGHEGNVLLKVKTIEDIDSKIVRPIYEAVQQWDEPVSIAILPDHPTPAELRIHVAEPVPFLIYNPLVAPDEVCVYDEESTKGGSYGLLHGDEFITKFICNT